MFLRVGDPLKVMEFVESQGFLNLISQLEGKLEMKVTTLN